MPAIGSHGVQLDAPVQFIYESLIQQFPQAPTTSRGKAMGHSRIFTGRIVQR